jgi:hypothetical protein
LQSSPRKNGFVLEQFKVIFVADNKALGQVFNEFGFLLSESFHQSSTVIITFMLISSDRQAAKLVKL